MANRVVTKPQRYRYKHKGVSLKDAFEVRFIPEPNSGCWLWTGSDLNGRRAYFCYQYRENTAARFSWEIYRGEIPEGLFVLHRCDNMWCVNPEHLFLGDQMANMKDAQAKSRSRQDPETGRFLNLPETQFRGF